MDPIATVPIVDVEQSTLPGHLAAPRRRPTEIIPALRPVAIAAYRVLRWLRWHTSSGPFAHTLRAEDLAFNIREHASPLLRALGASEMWLQHNKVTNLRLATQRIDGVLLKPGETFSFCRLVGSTTRRKGYLKGMMLEAGETVPGVGGGICQIANTLHWLVLHSQLTITERSTHSEDPFPDNGRTVPWGTGCTIFHNYVDLQIRNDTAATYQIRFRVSDTDLVGQLRCDTEPTKRYRVYARDERYLRAAGSYYRTNEIWRDSTDAAGNTTSELVKTNIARTLYSPEERT